MRRLAGTGTLLLAATLGYHYNALAHSVVAEELARTIVELVGPR